MAENKPAAHDPDAYDSVNNPGGKRPDAGDAAQPSAPASEPEPTTPSQPVEPNTTRNTPGLTEPARKR